MFKDEELFNGEAGQINEAIKCLNEFCKKHGWNVTYDVALHDTTTEETVEREGWLDCINIQRNGQTVVHYMCSSDVLNWIGGFYECLYVSQFVK